MVEDDTEDDEDADLEEEDFGPDYKKDEVNTQTTHISPINNTLYIHNIALFTHNPQK